MNEIIFLLTFFLSLCSLLGFTHYIQSAYTIYWNQSAKSSVWETLDVLITSWSFFPAVHPSLLTISRNDCRRLEDSNPDTSQDKRIVLLSQTSTDEVQLTTTSWESCGSRGERRYTSLSFRRKYLLVLLRRLCVQSANVNSTPPLKPNMLITMINILPTYLNKISFKSETSYSSKKTWQRRYDLVILPVE